MHRKLLGGFAAGVLGWAAACGGSERTFDTATGGNAGTGTTSTTSTSGGGRGGNGGSATTSTSTGTAGRGGTAGSGGSSGSAGSGGAAGGQAGSGGSAGSTPDASVPPDASVDAAKDASGQNDAADAREAIVDAPPDVPKSCKGPPLCSVAVSQVSCTGIRGCYWSQCTFRTPNTGVACGAEGPDRSNVCPPGCHLATNGNCVGNVNNDYYGSPDNCGAASRQTQNTCVGVGSVWQMCNWQAMVACVGQPTRTDCSGIMDPIICAQEGCSWQ